jgi:TetR/AcrR family transcriptional repressor of the ameABC operon
MPLSPETRESERKRIAQMVLDLVKERGTEISYQAALTESGLARSRFEQIFADYDELFDAVAQIWLAPHMKVMEEVLASDLPPPRKMYEFYRRRFVINRDRFRADPQNFTLISEMGAANFEKVRSYVDLADHYLAEIIVQAQADGFLAGLEIDEALSIINQMLSTYAIPDSIIYLGDKLTEEKLARIIDTIFAGLSAEMGDGARGLNTLKVLN